MIIKNSINMSTINDIIYSTQLLSPNESRLLLQQILNMSLEELIISSKNNLTYEQENLFDELCKRRLAGEPIAYILGIKEFYGHIFEVNKHVLIPRPETELIVDEAISFLKKRENPEMLDLCTGSGCIAISIATVVEGAKILATDICHNALEIAKQNSIKLGTNESISFLESNLFSSIGNKKFDLITCNPPYISQSEIYSMSREVVNFEPHKALFAEDNGLKMYEMIANEAKNFLRFNGVIILECGYKQASKICNIFENNGWQNRNIVKDLANIERCLIFQI